MKTLSQLSRRYLRTQKKRTLFTSLGIIMATALFVGVALLFSSLLDALITTESAGSGSWHYHVTGLTRSQAVKLQDHSLIDRTSAVAVSRLYARLEQTEENARPSGQPCWLILRDASDLDVYQTPYVNMISGRLPEDKDEIALDPVSRGQLGMPQLGDQINLDLAPFSDNPSSGTVVQRSYTVVGFFPWMESGLPSSVYHAMTIVPELEKAWYELYLSVRPARSYEDSLFTALDDVLPDNAGLSDRTQIKEGMPEPGVLRVRTHNALLRYLGQTSHSQTNRELGTVFTLLLLIILVSVVLVIRNSFAMSVTERISTFGLLRLVGTSPGQLRRLVLLEAVQLAILSIPLGLLAGIAAMAITLRVVSRVELPVIENLRLLVSPWPLLLAAFLSLLSILLAAIKPALMAGRMAPVEAVRQSQAYQLPADRSARQQNKGSISAFFFGAAGRLAGRNVQRDKRRFRTTTFSVAVSVTLFLAAGGLSLQMRQQIMLYNSEQTDFSLSAQSDQSGLSWNPLLEQAYQLIQEQPALEQSALYAIYSLAVPVAPEQLSDELVDTYIKMHDISGRTCTPAEAREQLLHEGCLEISMILADRPLLDELGLADPVRTWQALQEGQAVLCQTGSVQIGGIGGATVRVTNHKAGDTFPLQDVVEDDTEAGLGREKILLAMPAQLKVAAELAQLPWFFPGAFSSVPGVHLILSRQYAQDHFQITDEFYRQIGQILAINARGGSESDIQRLLNDLLGSQQETDGTLQRRVYLTDHYQSLRNARGMLFVFDLFIFGFSVVIILICAMNILNIITTSILLRRRELAMLRAVGMSRAQLKRMLLVECALYAFSGAIWGCLAGFTLLFALSSQADLLLAGVALASIPWPLLLWTLCGTLLLALAAGLLPVRRVLADSLVEAIRAEG